MTITFIHLHLCFHQGGQKSPPKIPLFQNHYHHLYSHSLKYLIILEETFDPPVDKYIVILNMSVKIKFYKKFHDKIYPFKVKNRSQFHLFIFICVFIKRVRKVYERFLFFTSTITVSIVIG